MREAKSQTQEEVSKAIGMGRVSYSQMENGSRKVMALDLAALCEFWKVPYEAMFIGCEERTGGAS
jgi:transcriptional regulator with XRE-family HTH domain